MHIVFLDEFGHIGPFVSRNHPEYNTSPVFGVSGFFLHERQVRDFGTWFFNLKKDVFEKDIRSSGKHPSVWEKKGYELFTQGQVHKNKRLGYSLINRVQQMGGKTFFHGVEKYQSVEESNPIGLYYTVLQHAITNLERCFANKAQNFLVVLDEHQNRAQLLESAIKTMYGSPYPAKHLLEPPYQVESHLYQTIQAADWISSIVGPYWAYKARPVEFSDRQWAEKFFESRLNTASTHSSVRLQRDKLRKR